MEWDVEFTEEFAAWWDGLTAADQKAVDRYVSMLVQAGPVLDHPYSSRIVTSAYNHMRELRVQSQGDPLRVFYAFDPRRVAMLLVGGDKTGQDRFYEEMVRKADAIYAQHLLELKKGR